MSRPSRWWQFTLFMGIVMIAIGAFLGLRPAFGGKNPVLGAWWLDAVAGVVFLIRGLINIRQAAARRRA